MSNFANALWVIVSMFVTVAYFVVLFQIVVDVFRDPDLSGKKKALWIACLFFFPLITAVVYVIRRGGGMAGRQHAARARLHADAEAYARSLGGPTSTEEIARAKSLLDAGAIDDAEFVALKRKAIEGPAHAAP